MTNDLDLPLLPSAEQIRQRRFATVWRGYDLDQVNEYLVQIAAQVETLEAELRERRMMPVREQRPATPTPGEALAAQVAAGSGGDPAVDPFDRLSKRFADVLRSADTEADRLVRDAREEAVSILGQARSEADRIRVDAQARAEEARQQGGEALAKAREEAERILGGLAERRESLVGQMHEMQSRLLSVAKELEVDDDGAEIQPDGFGALMAELQMRAGTDMDTDSGTGTGTDAGTDADTDTDTDTDDPLDPRYEDLWVTRETSVDIPDLASIELDFDDDSDD